MISLDSAIVPIGALLLFVAGHALGRKGRTRQDDVRQEFVEESLTTCLADLEQALRQIRQQSPARELVVAADVRLARLLGLVRIWRDGGDPHDPAGS